MTQLRGNTSGGQLLRKLRERKGWSQLQVEVETGVITQRNLSKIESGKAHPSREKLDAILDALNAHKLDCEQIYKYFGYLPPTELPTLDDVRDAIEFSQSILEKVTSIPIYLVDQVTRLWAWNAPFTWLLGRDQGGENQGEVILNSMYGMPLLQAAFQRKNELAELLEDHDEVMLDHTRSIYHRFDPYEKWYFNFLDELIYDEPDLAQYMERVMSEQEPNVNESPAQMLTPVQFHVPSIQTPLLFFGHAEPLTIDARFSMIYLLPSTAFTLEILSDWCASENLI